MARLVMIAAAAAALGACSGAAEEKKAEEKAAKLEAGEYEVSIKVDEVRSTDQTTPATSLKAGDTPEAVRTCVPADGKLEPKLFADAGDSCTQQSRYASRGRMSMQYQCTRAGKGPVSATVEGKFTKDSFEAKVATSTYMSGEGDYQLTRTLTGKRVGDCGAAAPAAPAAG